MRHIYDADRHTDRQTDRQTDRHARKPACIGMSVYMLPNMCYNTYANSIGVSHTHTRVCAHTCVIAHTHVYVHIHTCDRKSTLSKTSLDLYLELNLVRNSRSLGVGDSSINYNPRLVAPCQCPYLFFFQFYSKQKKTNPRLVVPCQCPYLCVGVWVCV